MQADNNSFADKMAKLKQLYQLHMVEWSREMEAYRQKHGSWSPEDVTVLRTLVHKLAGSGATYGFPEVTEVAKILQDKLVSTDVGCGNDSDPNSSMIVHDMLQKLISACSAENSA